MNFGKKFFSRNLWLLSMFLLLQSCIFDSPYLITNVTGIVSDVDAVPLSDVAVIIVTHVMRDTVLTNAGGEFSFEIEGGGIVELNFQKNGYQNERTMIKFLAGEHQNLSYQLTKSN
jgi:hypothetical protein